MAVARIGKGSRGRPHTGGSSGGIVDLGTWPFNNAYFRVDIVKVRLTTGPESGTDFGFPAYDPYWLDLRTGVEESRELSLKFTENGRPAPGDGTVYGSSGQFTTGPSTLDFDSFNGLQVRYMVRGVYVSDWLDAPWVWSLALSNANIPALDGVHDISLDVRLTETIVWDHNIGGEAPFHGRTLIRGDFFPQSIFLYLDRNRSVEPTVPILYHDAIYDQYGYTVGGRVAYVNHDDANRTKDFSIDGAVTPWTGDPTTEADLYQESMQPHNTWAQSCAKWYEIRGGNHAGLKYVRYHPTKSDETLGDLRQVGGHERFPFQDGPRGRGWCSSYISGQVTDEGEYYFAEAGGPIRLMFPDGGLVTVAGWRVDPAKDPIFGAHGTGVEIVRENCELIGDWTEGQYIDDYGMKTPADVALDPDDDTILYVAGYEDNCIWKVVVTNETYEAPASTITVFAGDVSHAAGYVNDTGHAARFNHPASITFDPVNDCLYVADQDNDCIRKITRAGVVTTLFGSLPGDTYRQLDYVFAHSSITLTGTVTVVSGTRTVTGTGTLFTTELKVGGYLDVEGEARLVKTITSDILLVTADATNPATNVPYPVFASNHTDATATRPNGTVPPYSQYDIQVGNRAVSQYTVTEEEAGDDITPDCLLPQCVRVDSNGDLVFIDIGFGSMRRYYIATGACEHLADVLQTYNGNESGATRRGWAWLDVDRWGVTGPLDGIWYGAFQQSFLDGESTTRTNETYGWMPSTGRPAHFLFVDAENNPDGWGPRGQTDPPHYMWAVAVDPRGAVYLAGGGESGVTRIRKTKAHDVTFVDGTDLTEFGHGKDVYSQIQGLNVTSYVTSEGVQGYYWVSPTLKYGFNCHNFLGFNDAWDYYGTSPTDETLKAAFGIDDTLVPGDHDNDSLRIAWALKFIRKNIGYQ